jgi:DUF1365 family protein
MPVSCLYEGTIGHRRRAPRSAFCHRIALVYLDLDELPGLLGGRLIRTRPGLLRFRRSDYLGDPDVPLDQAVRRHVQAHTGARPTGPIRLLTGLRSFGVCFNPVSFYYCFDSGGARLEHVVAEVTNTPWGERHAYVLSAGNDGSRMIRGSFDKALRVSPFLGMDHRYRARASTPGETLCVHISSEHADAIAFEAGLQLRRAELTVASVTRASLAGAGARFLALIYAHALALRLKGAPVHPHPSAAR